MAEDGDNVIRLAVDRAPVQHMPAEKDYSPDDLNREWAVVLVGQQAVMLRHRPDRPPRERVQIVSVRAFETWTANRVVLVEDKKKRGEFKEVPMSRLWLRDPNRRQFEGLTFAPAAIPEEAAEITPPAHFNLWQGFEVEPKAGGAFDPFLDHLMENVCDGSEELFLWLTGWMAHMVQRPRERLGTAVALRGGQGSGKTIVGRTLGRLFEAHYALVDDPRYVTGNFNSHLEATLLLQADEGFWAGDKTAEGRLKGLITSDVQMIERKGVDAIRLDNYVRLLITSNEDWVVPAGKDERRFAVFDVAPKRAQDHDYFRNIERTMADPRNRAGLLHYLLTLPLDDGDLRQVPRTRGLLDQKVRSLKPVEAWWLERLREGCQLPGDGQWRPWVATHRLLAAYQAAADRVGVRRKSFETEFGMELRRLAPGVERVQRREADDMGVSRRSWGYDFPSLEDARAAFEAALGQRLDWGVALEDDAGPAER